MKLTITEGKRPNGGSVLTVRVNGRYLGTLFAHPEEVAALDVLLTSGAENQHHMDDPEFEWVGDRG